MRYCSRARRRRVGKDAEQCQQCPPPPFRSSISHCQRLQRIGTANTTRRTHARDLPPLAPLTPAATTTEPLFILASSVPFHDRTELPDRKLLACFFVCAAQSRARSRNTRPTQPTILPSGGTLGLQQAIILPPSPDQPALDAGPPLPSDLSLPIQTKPHKMSSARPATPASPKNQKVKAAQPGQPMYGCGKSPAYPPHPQPCAPSANSYENTCSVSSTRTRRPPTPRSSTTRPSCGASSTRTP